FSLDVLHCYVVLGRFPVEAERGSALARLLLRANAFCRDTGGATLGLDGDEIILSRRLEISRADTGWLRLTVESLVMVAQDWSSKLDAAPPEARTHAVAFSMPDFGLRV
ncbi:MAG: type III secretion system chaperone, partial [Burkholderiaceae bacterium]|nr:type III secretion system chaperone [Burkholderiaceae bacterium]